MKLPTIPPGLAGKIVKNTARSRNQSDCRIWRVPPARKLRKNKDIYFPTSYSTCRIPLLIFPSTCMFTYPSKTTQVRIVNFGLMIWTYHFLDIFFVGSCYRAMSFTLEIHITGRVITSAMSTCEHPGLQCDIGPLTQNVVAVECPKEFPKLLCRKV